MRSSQRCTLAAAAMMTATGILASAASGGAPVSIYEVTITNLTDGQAFSPPVVAAHRRPTSLFEPGEPASVAIQEIAENGNSAPMLELLSADRHVWDLVSGMEPLVPEADPGETGFGHTVTFTVESARGAKFLSVAFMLICTNDGFSGLNGVRLPRHVGQAATYYTGAYDAGTEINTEDFADLVPPCQGLIGVSSEDEGTGMSDPALAEDGLIQSHLGILGIDDLLPDLHGWIDPVAEIVITRVN